MRIGRTKPFHHTWPISLLAILLLGGVLHLKRDVHNYLDRHFTQPQPLDLATLSQAPTTYQDRYIQVEGILRRTNYFLCEGQTLVPPGGLTLSSAAGSIAVKAAWPDHFPPETPYGSTAVVTGWLRGFVGRVGCDHRSVGGPDETEIRTMWYIEPATITLGVS